MIRRLARGGAAVHAAGGDAQVARRHDPVEPGDRAARMEARAGIGKGEIAAEVAQAYFALRLDQEQIAVIQSELVSQQRSLDIAGNIARVGLVPSIDVTHRFSVRNPNGPTVPCAPWFDGPYMWL